MSKTTVYLYNPVQKTWFGRDYYEIPRDIVDIPKEGWDVTFKISSNTKPRKGKMIAMETNDIIRSDAEHIYVKRSWQYAIVTKLGTHYLDRSQDLKNYEIYHNGKRIILRVLYKIEGDQHIPCDYVNGQWYYNNQPVFLKLKHCL